MGGSFGCEDELWKPYSNIVREKHMSDVTRFLSFLPATFTERRCHEKLLEFMATLEKSSFDTGEDNNVFGCGLPYLANKIKERFNKLSIRRIGDQAITIARHSYRLADSLQTSTETEPKA